MRLHLPIPPASPLPHQPEPPPLLPSPSSLLGLTASQKRRRKQFVRASSFEPTVAGGLANWRRQPKKVGSGTGTATTGSAGTSETKKARKGVGMGMQGTPAKKGKRSGSRSMGVHSTPAAKIRSRTQSLSQAKDTTTMPIGGESSLSYLGSLPSSADIETPSPQSQILDLSSPSVPAIPTLSRKWDVFDGAYILSPKEITVEEQENFDRLVQDAEDDQMDQQLPEEVEMLEEEEMDGLFGWKEDVLWFLRGSTESASDAHDTAPAGNSGPDDADDPTNRDQGTIYHDVLISMNDNSESPRSLSSRTKRRSSTIQNRQPTPHRRNTTSAGGSTIRKPSRTVDGPHDLESSQEDDTFYTARSGSDSQVHASDEEVSGSEEVDEVLAGPGNIQPSHSTSASKPVRRPRGAGSTVAGNHGHSSIAGRDTAAQSPAPDDITAPLQPEQSTLSQLLKYTDPIPPGVTLSQLLQSTQSANETQDLGAVGLDDSVELGRGGRVAVPDLPDERPAPTSSIRLSRQSPIILTVDSVLDGDNDINGASSDGPQPLYSPQMEFLNDDPMHQWKLDIPTGIPTPYTPSSHLSPRSVQLPLSPISFAATRSPSAQLRITPPPPVRTASKKRQGKLIRKGAWRGAEVLARMEEADRGTARYHMAFDPASPIDEEDEEEAGRTSTGGKKRSSLAAVVYEESEEVLEARRRRLEHYRELEEGYRLHVELVL